MRCTYWRDAGRLPALGERERRRMGGTPHAAPRSASIRPDGRRAGLFYVPPVNEMSAARLGAAHQY
jgi:hypothetical protein